MYSQIPTQKKEEPHTLKHQEVFKERLASFLQVQSLSSASPDPDLSYRSKIDPVPDQPSQNSVDPSPASPQLTEVS